jgi:carboxypeptidase family protein/TonB-dependent receptor-like protein
VNHASALRPLRALAWMAWLLVGHLEAQGATGKLQGLVRDELGSPIAAAQLYLVGTAFSAVTDPRGHYFINNVPAGSWAIRAIFLGYHPQEIRGLRMLADQTVTQDFVLIPAPLQLREITVMAAENLLVPRDEVTTKQRVDGQFADDLPVDRLDDLLALQPGVVEVTQSALTGAARESAGGLSIRGGRETQNATYLDGVPIQPGYKGDRLYGWADLGSTGTSITIGTNAIEEASVTTGSSSAEFGNATAGIIAIVTRTGDTRYRGALSAETDEPFGVNRSPGLNRLEAGLSGPVTRRLSFAINGVLEGRRSVEEGFGSQNVPIFLPAGVDTTIRQTSILEDDTTTAADERLTADTTLVNVYRYAISRGTCDEFADAGAAGITGSDSTAIRAIRSNYGFDCNGVRVPATARTLYALNGKLTHTYGTGSRISLGLAQSRFHGHQFDFIIRHVNRLSLPQNLKGFSNRNRLATLNWVQNLSRSAERALALDVALSYQQDRTISGPLTIESELSTRDPWGGFILAPMRFQFDFDNFPLDDRLIRNIRRNEGRKTPHDPNNGTYEITDNLRDDAYGLYGRFGGFSSTMGTNTWLFGESGGVPAGPLNLYREDRFIGKATLDWQADRYNRLKLGGEITRYAIDYYASHLSFAGDAYIERPIRWNGFVEDRLDLGDVVVVGGLRFDWYDSRASRPYATDSVGNRYPFPRISTMPGFDRMNPTALYVRDRSHRYLSPHVQVSFPVTDRTNFRLSYSHQVQAPDFGLLLSGVNMDLTGSNQGQVFGSDLDFGKTIAFEFGIRHAFSDDMVLDLAAYNKNIIADPAVRLVTRYDPALLRDDNIRVLTNLDFGHIRGLDVRLDRRFGRFFNGTVGYAYQHARNTGSDPFTYIYYGSLIVNEVGGINGVQPPPQGILPTDDSRPHALTGAFSITFPGDWKRGSVLGMILGNLSAFSTFRYTSGTAYSKCGKSSEDQSVLSVENCLRQFPEGLNSRRLPPFKELNARFTKSFGLGEVDLTAYLDVRNLLNFRNVLQVFAVNGSIRNDIEREANLDADLDDIREEARINGALNADNSIVLPAAHEACATWISNLEFRPTAANCIYLIRAEQRFGNGDGIYTGSEQSRAINALYDVARGPQQHIGLGRRARIGVEIDF